MLFHISKLLRTAINSLLLLLRLLKFLAQSFCHCSSSNHDLASKLFFKSMNSSSAASGTSGTLVLKGLIVREKNLEHLSGKYFLIWTVRFFKCFCIKPYKTSMSILFATSSTSWAIVEIVYNFFWLKKFDPEF